jgi:hypothetical protein
MPYTTVLAPGPMCLRWQGVTVHVHEEKKV